MLTPDVGVAIAGMAVASYTCRVAGFWAMGFVPLTPRVRAWLEAVPISVMVSIVAVTAATGGPAEWLGLGAALGMMRATGNELVGLVSGVAAVALARFTLG